MAYFVGSLKFNAIRIGGQPRDAVRSRGGPIPDHPSHAADGRDSRERQEFLECEMVRIPKTLLSLLFFPMHVQFFRRIFENV